MRDLLNDFLPLSGDDSWKCYELDNGNMTCARYYFSENYSVKPGSRISASLIDLPSEYPKDIMIINTHLKCCGGSQNNAIRQEECDAVAAFIKDAKNSGGAVSLPYATPIIISGDLNLVGYSQQLYTLLAGDIVNNDIYGEDSPPDWDDTELCDIISFQTDQRFAYTWVNSSSDYWPGRLDYTIATDVGLSIQKTFTLNTMVMKPERLSLMNLQQHDTQTASDHLPKVTDFGIEETSGFSNDEISDIFISPNPSKSGKFRVGNIDIENSFNYQLFSISGRAIKTGILSENRIIDLSKEPSGIYLLKIQQKNNPVVIKLVKCN